MKKILLVILRLGLTALVFVLVACETNPNLEIVEKNKQQLVADTDQYVYESYEKSINSDDAFLRFQTFNGTDTILKFNGGCQVTLIVSKSVNEGNVVFVLIDPYDQMTVLSETTTISASQGQYRIKVIGDHASGMISIQMTVAEQDPLSLFE
jgi:hypothetical protein